MDDPLDHIFESLPADRRRKIEACIKYKIGDLDIDHYKEEEKDCNDCVN